MLDRNKFGLTEHQMNRLRPVLDEMDRNARAYGWEIGRGQPLLDELTYSDDNPFIDPEWRENVSTTPSSSAGSN
jgi:hypothetical protein